jgi:hypothetical protein
VIYLVKHFLLRARPKLALLVSLGAVAWFLGNWHLFRGEMFSFLLVTSYMIVGSYDMFMVVAIMEAEEFDLVLPVRRRRLYAARSLAVSLLVVIMAAPVSVTAWAAVSFQGFTPEPSRTAVTCALWLIALPLIAASLVRFVKRMPSPPAMGRVAVFLAAIFVLMMTAAERRISSLLPAGMALLATALAWFVGRWEFERFELAPSGDAGPARVAVDRLGLVDRLSPTIRVLLRAVWLQWRFLLMLAGIGSFLAYMLTGDNAGFSYFYLCAIFGNVILGLFNMTAWTLLPFVSRRTILRSVLGPFAAAPLLIGCVEAITSGSAQMIVRGLALTLVIVGMTWLMLPSAKEYRRPLLVSVRHMIWWILFICILLFGFVRSSRRFFWHPLSWSWPGITPLVAGNPLLVSCVVVLAIALFWWRCERKFRYFEPSALPAGYSRTT